jgi:hypothetical protein
VKTCEVIQENGKTFQRETSRHGQTVTYAIEGVRPPYALRRRIATKDLPYGGTWYVALEQEGDSTSETRVQITEDGEVYNPVFRFVSKYIMGETATQDAYLKAMGKAVGEDVQVGD